MSWLAFLIAKIAIPPQVLVALKAAKNGAVLILMLGAGVVMAIQHAKIVHDTKVIIAARTWQDGVVAEVASGTGGKVKPDEVVARIHDAFGNVAVLNKAVDRQNAAVKVANDRAKAAQAGVAAALAPTQAQKDREATREAIVAPNRTDGLVQAEWDAL